MPHLKLIEVTVEGAGNFPIDLLREDQLWPCSEADSALLMSNLSDRIPSLGITRIKLCGLHEDVWGPNSVAWIRYGWKVKDVQVRPV